MGGVFKEYQPDQGQLFPPSPRDWLPKGHPVWFLADAVDALDIEPILARYRVSGKGQQAYQPRMLLKLLVYAYSCGVFSSRKIAQMAEDNVAMRYLVGSTELPSHRTICRFREENRGHFKALFLQVLQIAATAGLTKFGTLAIDGSKIEANASKHKAMSYERMLTEEVRLKGEIDAIVTAAKKQDDLEDGQFGPDFRGDELPAELERRETRLATIQAAKKRLEERAAARAAEEQRAKEPTDEEPPKSAQRRRPSSQSKPKPEAKDQENFTDPDSRIMKHGRGGFEQSYNAQIAVDAQAQLIVAAQVKQCASDAPQLVPMVAAIEQNTGMMSARVLADAGYRSDENFKQLKDVDLFVSLGREGKAGVLGERARAATRAMARKVRSKRGRAIYRLRKQIVEPVFGWIKSALGFRRFSMRGLDKVTAEWNLVCTIINLRRLAAMKARI